MRSNKEMIRDFLDLSFHLETGIELTQFSRMEEPITVRVTGSRLPESFIYDFSELMHRLDREAKLKIRPTTDPNATITINLVKPELMRRIQPRAACFVVPNISDLSQYRAAMRRRITDWRSIVVRKKMGIFIPINAPPQEMRDCLHEELAQALGPLNDLYRLPDSVFNDDNVHTVLTGFDMLMLRVTYAPELQPGMTREQVAARLPAIFRRMNPAGERKPSHPSQPTTVDWTRAINTALGPSASMNQRSRASFKALKIAQSRGWQDQRLALSYFMAGRMAMDSNQYTGLTYIQNADKIYASSPIYRLPRARSMGQLAALELQNGEPEQALARLNPAIETAIEYQNAALLTGLLVLKSEALLEMGKAEEAQALRLDTLGWARYGFGDQWAERSNVHIIVPNAFRQLTNK